MKFGSISFQLFEKKKIKQAKQSKPKKGPTKKNSNQKNPNKKIQDDPDSLNPKKHRRSWPDGLGDVPNYSECVLGADSGNFLWK